MLSRGAWMPLTFRAGIEERAFLGDSVRSVSDSRWCKLPEFYFGVEKLPLYRLDRILKMFGTLIPWWLCVARKPSPTPSHSITGRPGDTDNKDRLHGKRQS